jgi:hypothetical protein
MELIRTDLAKIIATNAQPDMLAKIKVRIPSHVPQEATRRLDQWSAPVAKLVTFAPPQEEHSGFARTDPTPSRIGLTASSVLRVTAV